jgi:hypothetical protein
VSITPDPAVAELRVLWFPSTSRSVEATLARLGELTDCAVLAQTSRGKRRRYVLQRRRSTVALEAAWRRQTLLRTVEQLLRAADQHERGTLDPASFSPGVRIYAERRAAEYRYLRRLNPEGWDELLAGEEVWFPPGIVNEEEIRPIIEGWRRFFG